MSVNNMQLSLTYHVMVTKVNCYFFKGRSASTIISGIKVNGAIVHISEMLSISAII